MCSSDLPDRGTALRTDELHAKQQLVGIEGNLVIAHRARDGLFGIDHDLFEIVGFLLADAEAGTEVEVGTATGWMALVYRSRMVSTPVGNGSGLAFRLTFKLLRWSEPLPPCDDRAIFPFNLAR